MFVAGMVACFLDNTVPGQFYALLIPTPTPLHNPHLENVYFLSGLTAIWISIRQHDSSSTIDIYFSTSQLSFSKYMCPLIVCLNYIKSIYYNSNYFSLYSCMSISIHFAWSLKNNLSILISSKRDWLPSKCASSWSADIHLLEHLVISFNKRNNSDALPKNYLILTRCDILFYWLYSFFNIAHVTIRSACNFILFIFTL